MNKHQIAFIMIFVLLFSLAACKAKEQVSESADFTETVSSEETKNVTEETKLLDVPGVEYLGEDAADISVDDDIPLAIEGKNDAAEPTIKHSEESNTSSAEQDSTNLDSQDNVDSETSTEPTSATAPTVPQETKPVITPGTTQVLTEFEKYNAMSGEEQMAFMQSFDSIDAFFAWYDNAKAEYEALHPDIVIEDGVIDAGDLVG